MSSDPREELWRGKRVVWRHKPRGGYGYVMRIPVTVVQQHARTVTVRLDGGREVRVALGNIIQPDMMLHVIPTLEPRQEG